MGESTEELFYLIDKDVRGYYPNLILTLNLYPQLMGPAFLQVYKNIVARREAAKASKNFAVDKGLKIVVNGTSGKFSDYWSAMYSPDLTIQVTVTGQLALLMLIEMLELNGIEVISANTDGIVMKCPVSKRNRMNEIAKLWETATGLETEETEYRAYYARDVNNYFAVKLDGTVKVKGAYSEVGSQSGTKLDTNPVVLVCTDAVKALLSKGIPIEKTITECKDFSRFVTVRQVKGGAHKNKEYLGKVVRFYYAKNEKGTINYVLNNNTVAETLGAKPAMDMPKEFPTDIDYAYYIKRTLDILYDIGYHIKPKQIEFF